ncbi:hypothetical protein JTE90_000860 [Oedothorax gibbosus]|uniref:Carboxylesterase type B domain-containing protein n=1 Tax=Oedothorax gibbosus TaxID=931172 RepID=A0AAV6VSB5_9ARAC|nr:hypothetical protein JTE90_000860 [Oedothorax gibbosus]
MLKSYPFIAKGKDFYVSIVGRDDSARLPVMVFIHGESYDWNSGNSYDGSVLASFGNVVVVTINFRLGLLGFLPALDDSSRGNYGLMDQVAALHWIQENIPGFGGNPKNVTVFGHGNGAACVNLLMLSPLARGLFQRAILQSGSALSPWAIARDALTYTRQVAAHCKCPTKDNTAMVACLGKRPVQDILNTPLRVPDHLTAFGPTIDGVVIPGEPAILMEKNNDLFSQYDLLVGVSRIEYYFRFSSQEDRMGIDVSRRDRLLRTLVRNLFTYHLQEIFLTVVNEYTDWSKPDQHPINVLDSTADAMGDALIVAPLIRTGTYHSKAQKKADPKGTYLYVFMYQTEESFYGQRMGCIHGEDVPYVFGAPMVNSLAHFHRNFSRMESSLSEAVMTYWTNFVKFGNPNTISEEGEGKPSSERGRGRFEKTVWPLYDSAHQKYIAIAPKPRLKDHYHAHRLSFWLNLIPTLHRSASAAEETASARHHQLEDHDDPRTYDGVFRRRPPSHQPDKTTTSTTQYPVATRQVTSTEVTAVSTPFAITTPVMNDTDTLAMTMQQATYSTVLTITIVFGCCILAINSLICCAIYYKKDRGNRAECLQKREYQLHPDGSLSCNSTPQSKKQAPHLLPSPMDHLPPPSFMTLATLSEAGSLPSKCPPQQQEVQPLLPAAHMHWPPPQQQVGNGGGRKEQEMRVVHFITPSFLGSKQVEGIGVAPIQGPPCSNKDRNSAPLTTFNFVHVLDLCVGGRFAPRCAQVPSNTLYGFGGLQYEVVTSLLLFMTIINLSKSGSLTFKCPPQQQEVQPLLPADAHMHWPPPQQLVGNGGGRKEQEMRVCIRVFFQYRGPYFK